jgi:hypothetical protein
MPCGTAGHGMILHHARPYPASGCRTPLSCQLVPSLWACQLPGTSRTARALARGRYGPCGLALVRDFDSAMRRFKSSRPSHEVGLHAPVLFGTCHYISQGGAAPEGRPAAFMPAPVTRTTFLESSFSLQGQPASVSTIAYSISSMSSGTRTPAVMAKPSSV